MGDEVVLSVGWGRAYGAELFFREQDLRGWNLILSYTYVRSEFSDHRVQYNRTHFAAHTRAGSLKQLPELSWNSNPGLFRVFFFLFCRPDQNELFMNSFVTMNRIAIFVAAIAILSLSFYPVRVHGDEGLRVYISVDMEGVAGVVASDQVRAGGHDYSLARQWATLEANAAIQGALDAGATYIVVNDSHGGMRNLIASEINPAARLITGSPKPLSMMEGIGENFDAVVFIGYHARAGSFDGVLDHTYSSASVYSIKVNGQEMGEAGINALIAGYYGVAVVMVSGDEVFCEQARSLLGEHLVTTPVKQGIGRTAANTLVPSRAAELIRENTALALNGRGRATPFRPGPETSLEVSFLFSSQAQSATLIPGVDRTGPRSVAFAREDFIEVFQLLRAVLLIARD